MPYFVHRESEVLEKKVEGAIILREEEAYLRTIGVGRYELTLDIMEEDLENTREKLAEVRLTRVTLYCTLIQWDTHKI